MLRRAAMKVCVQTGQLAVLPLRPATAEARRAGCNALDTRLASADPWHPGGGAIMPAPCQARAASAPAAGQPPYSAAAPQASASDARIAHGTGWTHRRPVRWHGRHPAF